MDYPVYVHELNVKDPYILADPVTKKYYMYANKFRCGTTDPDERKGTGETFYAIVSEDLVNWSDPILVFEQNDFWASTDYSGPEVYYRNGAYYMIASFGAPGRLRKIQALKADSPLGPFAPIGEPLSPPAWQVMDGTLYVDEENNETWLVFAHDWVQVYDGQIAAIRVSDDLTHSIGNPVILFRGSDAPWGDDFMYCSNEGGGAASGPCVHRMADGGLVILWTNQTPYGNAIGIAKSETGTIFGPWKQFDKPVYGLDGAHASLFRRLNDGMIMMPFYCEAKGGMGLRTCIMEMEEYWRTGLLDTVHEFTGNYNWAIGGHAVPYRKNFPLPDAPAFTTMQDYGGPMAKRKFKWAAAPDTAFNKGKITTKD